MTPTGNPENADGDEATNKARSGSGHKDASEGIGHGEGESIGSGNAGGGIEGATDTSSATDINRRMAQAVNSLARPDEFKGKSRILILRRLPWNRKWAYFRDQLLLRTGVAVTAIVVVVLLVVHFLSPAAPPKLYVAVFGGVLQTQDSETMQQQVSTALKLPKGRNGGVMIDASFGQDGNGLSKLQTMLSNHEIDVVIASPKVFSVLAGYGYMVNLDKELTVSQKSSYSKDFVSFRGYNDAHYNDINYNGSGKGPAEPYGLRLHDWGTWGSFTTASSTAVAGLAQNSRNGLQAKQFLAFLHRQ
jgi:hypothetical protein